jgi:ATPase subunit of ABC transporter with duplicated ATPase domains
VAIVVSDLEYVHPGGTLLFSNVSFRIGEREHAALVGVNGVGKTTLFRLITRELQPSQGAIQIDGRLQFMPQQIGRMYAGATIRELLAEVSGEPFRKAALDLIKAERAMATDYSDATGEAYAEAIAHWGEVGGYQQEGVWDRVTSLVLGQSLDEAADRPVAQLSGGEQKRLALEMLVASDAENVLLDEPDNFLDIAGKRWLERKLNELNKTILIISHDRELLTRAARKIVTLEGYGAWVHGESFATYSDARTARQERLEDALQRWNDEERRLYRHMKIMKQRAAVNDGNAAAADAAETRWKKFVAAGPPDAPVRNQRIHMRLRGGDSGRKVLECESLRLAGVVNPFDATIMFGERVAVVGPNGSGKSHFLRLLAGEPIEHAGTFRLGARIVVGFFSQLHDHPEWTGKTILDILAAAAHLTYPKSMALLARYEIQGCAEQKFETLSGGQQARLQVLLLEQAGANLLLLDEPTDNLDLDSSESLEHALEEFRGTVVGVTHDRWFMRTFDRFLYFDHQGDVSEALDIDTILPVLAGEVTVATAGRKLKRLTVGGATTPSIAARPDRVDRRARTR